MTKRDPQINVRLPQELKEKLHQLAEKNKRSANAEVIAAIELAIHLDGQVTQDAEGKIEIRLSKEESKILEKQIETLKQIKAAEEKIDQLFTALNQAKKA
ncbi:regulatory protein Mnt [Klebsiella pneumoniae]|uniref:Regulatory protein Mnt n=1 Tax=Klebsiella pneumoniae TaxID=573 RepID=A0A378BYU6_KLEPN|nr:regulatory protein Mnt [Klebsiella pneumoniae]STU27192.1 regulatory protein Mnt [Klebsiella pneumoniae]STU29495.1 regulatory protein Mnt [Klebsiella pneumoniae]STU52883.1 regulatory protein Mnt [Klebsiella pneumoniae]STV55970.1 regulatory protein Mnt [Klebsiella pneumoniae]